MDFFRQFYDGSPDIVASAPGRVEILGNHTDYNGGTVVGAAIDLRLRVAVRTRSDGRIRLASTSTEERFETSLTAYREATGPEWSRYPLGVADELLMLARSGTSSGSSSVPDAGFDLAVDSDIPAGAGVSSSAALELATALALNELWDCGFGIEGLIHLAHRAENRYVGVPCGLLDQAVCGAGRSNELVVVHAAEGRIARVPFPSGTRLVLCTSHVRRSLAGSMYEARYDECRQALIAYSRFMPRLGHLTNLHPVDTAVYGPTIDPVLRRRSEHIVGEEFRVRRFLEILERVSTDEHAPPEALSEAGSLLTASHQSSRVLFQNSIPELDFLVDRFTEALGVLGARLTGAGWGGAVVAWVDNRFTDDALEPITNAYFDEYDAEAEARIVRPSEGARIES